MTTEMIALISGLTGAIIGAASSVLIILIQERQQTKRERSRLAAELGMKDHEHALETSKRMSGQVAIYPLTSYVLLHDRIIRQLEKGSFSAEDYQRIMDEQAQIQEVIIAVTKDRKIKAQQEHVAEPAH